MPEKPPHQIVHLLASISTILALVIMLVERVATHPTFPPQQEAWRWILCSLRRCALLEPSCT